MIGQSLTIKVNAGELEGQLRTNLVKHQREYREAMEGYWVEYEKRLKNALAEAGLMKDALDPKRPPEHPTGGMQTPQSHEQDYEQAISMMERVADDTEIELGWDQYRQFWMDEWGWKQQFTTTNSYYTNL